MLGLVAGMVAVVTFFAAVGLAAGTVMPGQAAITATGIGVFAMVPRHQREPAPALEPPKPADAVTEVTP